MKPAPTPVGHSLTLQPPFAQERFAVLLDISLGRRVDHAAVILGQFVMHVLGRMLLPVPRK